MASSLEVEEDKGLDEKLLEAANKLLDPPSTLHHLLPLLQQVESCLGLVEQSPTESVQAAMAPLAVALIGDKLLSHADVDVKVVVASCISEITRISAPDAPLDDDQMKEAFQLVVSSFENLHDMSSRSYRKRTGILETVSKVRSCVVMLDLECDDLILEMFQHFLKEIRFYKGVIECFIHAKKMHQVTYDDGEIEILNLKNETWEIIEVGADSDGEEGADHPSPDVSADMPPKKKGKASTADTKKGGNKDASSISGGATSSKSRGKSMKSSRRSKDGSKSVRKSKVSKTAYSESDDEVIIKTKNDTPKSGGSGKSIDAAARKMSSNKSKDIDKDDVVSTPKLSGKAKQEIPKAGKLKQETAAASSKAAKSSKSGGKYNANATSKVKFKLLKDSEEDGNSEDSTKEVVEDTKAKKPSSLKASGGSEVKIGKKRARN